MSLIENTLRVERQWDLPAILRNALNTDAAYGAAVSLAITAGNVARWQVNTFGAKPLYFFRLWFASDTNIGFTLYYTGVAANLTTFPLVGLSFASPGCASIGSAGIVTPPTLSNPIAGGFCRAFETVDLCRDQWYLTIPAASLILVTQSLVANVTITCGCAEYDD